MGGERGRDRDRQTDRKAMCGSILLDCTFKRLLDGRTVLSMLLHITLVLGNIDIL